MYSLYRRGAGFVMRASVRNFIRIVGIKHFDEFKIPPHSLLHQSSQDHMNLGVIIEDVIRSSIDDGHNVLNLHLYISKYKLSKV